MKFRILLLSSVLLLSCPLIVYGQNGGDDDELLYRKVRLALIPGLSTNGLDAPRYEAKYSLNVLMGYNGALTGYELGFVNINRVYARGIQIGGAHISGGETLGVQLAGLGTVSKTDMRGVQISGWGNISGGDMQGLQFAGIINRGFELQGIQSAGVANISRMEMQGIQSAGVLNFVSGSMQGIQAAGVANFASKEMEGIQAAGIANITRDQLGISAAGVLNLTGRMQGIQIGTVNMTERGQGMQIGVINMGREFQGLPVGLISYYGDGRKNIDIWTGDGGFTHVGLNLGTRRIYNMVSAGYNPLINDRDVWAIGWTIGSYQTLDERWDRPALEDYFSTKDLSIQRIFDDGWSRTPNVMYSYRYLLGRNFSGGTVYAGPTANLLVSQVEGSSDYTWYSLIDGTISDRDVRFWIGLSAGFRLFNQ